MAVEDLCPPSSEICSVPVSENPEPDVELGCSRKKKRSEKKRCKVESNDKSSESPFLQSQLVKLSDQQAPQPLTENNATITDSESPQSDVGLSPSIKKKKKKKKKKKGCTTYETNDTSCGTPSLQPQIVQLSDQQAPQPLAEKLTTITDSESPQPHIELSLSQSKKKKKKKECKTPKTNDKSCESPSVQPQLVQVTDQKLEVPKESSFSVKNKKGHGKKSRKPHDCNDEVCGSSVPSIMENNMQEVDTDIQPSVEISLKQLVAEPLVEGRSTTTKSNCSNPNADFGCSQETKKKKRKRSHKTNENKELSVEAMMPEADPSLQPSLAMFSAQELEVSQPLNVDAEPLVEGINTTINSESPSLEADFNCSEEAKKKKRKRERKTSDTNEVLVGLPDAESSLQPSLTLFSEQELEVAQPLNADAEPLVERMSTTINSESNSRNTDFSCSQESKKKKRRKGCKFSDSKKLLVEVTTPEADPSLQPLLAVFSEHELEVPPPLNTDAEPVVEGMSMTMNSESPNPHFQQESKKKKRKKGCKTSDSKKLLQEIITPKSDPSSQPTPSEKELEVAQPVNTDAEPMEGMNTTMNSESSKPSAEFSYPQEMKKKNRKKKRKTSESKELLVEVMTPKADPSLQPLLAIFSEHELEVARPLNTGVEGKETKIDEVLSLSHLAPKADTEVVAISREGNLLEMSNSSPGRSLLDCSRKKLLILDINGLLADIVHLEVSRRFKPDTIISQKAVFKRPFCDDFLQFCFDKFNVGVWSSRTKKNVVSVIDFLLGDSKHKLLFCWNQSHCTSTRFKTVENKDKPLVLKELRKLWEKLEPDLPWAKGEYNESNTLLLDDSPYKALGNPVNTAIFPDSYKFRNKKDSSLGPGGDIRSYLEGLAMAESVQKYVEQNPFGQRPITKSNPSWNFYRRVIEAVIPLR